MSFSLFCYKVLNKYWTLSVYIQLLFCVVIFLFVLRTRNKLLLCICCLLNEGVLYVYGCLFAVAYTKCSLVSAAFMGSSFPLKLIVHNNV